MGMRGSENGPGRTVSGLQRKISLIKAQSVKSSVATGVKGAARTIAWICIHARPRIIEPQNSSTQAAICERGGTSRLRDVTRCMAGIVVAINS